MRILVIEDDKQQCMLLQFRLEQEGYDIDLCYDGDDADYYLSQNAYDLVLLDRMLPHKDGLSILGEMRSSGNHTPVILLTALGELGDKITGLDSGADDYLVKPFAYEELSARIRCLLRRPSKLQQKNQIQVGDVIYHQEENQLKGKTGSCTLSQKEGSLLLLFLNNPNQTLPRGTILTRVWGVDYEIEEGNLDNYIYFVRRRLKTVGSNLKIQTVRGIGYVLRTELEYVS